MINIVNRQLSGKNIFSDLNDHDLEHELHTVDSHSSQLKKKIIEIYTTLRLLTYGKHYNKDILQQLTKIFYSRAFKHHFILRRTDLKIHPQGTSCIL